MVTSGKPTVISTFAGTGGSSLGYHWAGFRELLAIDFDAHAVQCFKLNFPMVPVWHKSVTDVKGQDILEFCKIDRGDLDVFDGSPPCQGFSKAGSRIVKDPRNDLFVQYVRLVDELQPKVFVMENVSGMAKGKMKGKFIEIITTLKSLNYEVKAKQMNAMYYGVPQSRERIIFIGVRKDLNKHPVFPAPNNELITCRKALEGVEPNEIHPLTDKYGLLWPRLKPGQNAAVILGTGQNSCVILNPTRPACTLPKMQGGKGFATICHWNAPRAIAINEAKRLCSFPDDWKLVGKYSEQWARLGNAVMPKFMQAIAETIKNDIINPAIQSKSNGG